MRYIRLGAVIALGLLCSTAFAIEVSDAWARATAPGQDVAAAYLTILSKTTATLVAVKTPMAKHVEIHSSSMEEGVMRMRELKTLELSAGKSVTLAPMGTHLMLIQLKSALKAGEQVPLELIVLEGKKRRTYHIKLAVRAMTH